MKLKMNMDKSTVTSVFSPKFKFLGFTLGKNGQGIHILAHKKSLKKAKRKLKEKTKRSQPKTVRAVMKDVERYIRGWLSYYYIASIKNTLKGWNEWLRRRVRMYIWKQWKVPKARVKALIKLRIPKDKAYEWANSRLGYWRVAGSPILSRAIDNKRLALAVYYDFPARYESLRKLHLCD